MALLACLFLISMFVVSNSEMPPIDKCRLTDSVCMKASIQKAVPAFMAGIPEIGIEVLDVMDMADVNMNIAGLQFKLTDAKLKGLKGAVIDTVNWDVKKKKVEIEYRLNGTVRGHYTASGRILILPITGDGTMKLKLRNLWIKLFLEFDEVKGEDGKERYVPRTYGFEFDVLDNAHFSLTNLFNGNKQLSDVTLSFLNQNWKQVVREFGEPLVEAAAKKLYKSVSTFFKHFPIWDIALM